MFRAIASAIQRMIATIDAHSFHANVLVSALALCEPIFYCSRNDDLDIMDK
jgi:hypothetical protein